MKRIIWGCEVCPKEHEGAKPPQGWIETSYFDTRANDYRRFIVCSYEHLIKWAENKMAREVKQNE